MSVVSELSKRLADAKGDRSIDDIARQAERKGHRLDRSAIARYVKGEHGSNTRPSTIEALAAGFDLDPRELRELAGRPPGELGRYEPVPESASLTQRQRDALDLLIKAIVSEGGESGGLDIPEKMDDGVVTPIRPDGVRRKAAREADVPDKQD